MGNQIIDAVTAQALYADACHDHALAGWVVIRDQPEPGAFVARLVTDAPTPYILRADTLAGCTPSCHLAWCVPSARPRIRRIWWKSGLPRSAARPGRLAG